MGDPYAPIVIRTVEDGGYAPSSSASYGAAGTSGGYSDDRDDSPNASNRKRGGIVGQLFGSSASAPVAGAGETSFCFGGVGSTAPCLAQNAP